MSSVPDRSYCSHLSSVTQVQHAARALGPSKADREAPEREVLREVALVRADADRALAALGSEERPS